MSAHAAASLLVITLKPAPSAFLARGRTFAKRNGDILDAAVAQVLGVGVALAAVADNCDLLVGDQVDVAVGVVIDLHRVILLAARRRALSLNAFRHDGAGFDLGFSGN